MDGLIVRRGRDGGDALRIPLLAKFVRGGEVGGGIDLLVAGIDDKINVRTRQLAANESEPVLHRFVSVPELEIGLGGALQSVPELARIRNECESIGIEKLPR